MARPVNANAEKTKARILDSASRLFASHGVGQVSIRQIAKDADVSLGMVNHYFGSKDELYHACIDAMYAELALLRDALVAEAVAGGSVRELVERAVLTGFRFARAHQSAVRLVMRAVVDRGMLDEGRQKSFQRPFLDQASTALGAMLEREPAPLRLVLQSLNFLVVRYALGQMEELTMVAGVSSREHREALSRVEAHLVSTALAMLDMPSPDHVRPVD